jgi:hypothetical protein
LPDKTKRVDDAIDRAVLIARRIGAKSDLDVRRRIEAFDEKLDGVQQLGIAVDFPVDHPDYRCQGGAGLPALQHGDHADH